MRTDGSTSDRPIVEPPVRITPDPAVVEAHLVEVRRMLEDLLPEVRALLRRVREARAEHWALRCELLGEEPPAGHA